MRLAITCAALMLPLLGMAQDAGTRQAVSSSLENAAAMRQTAAGTFDVSQRQTAALLKVDHDVLKTMVDDANEKRLSYVRDMYKKNLPADVAARIKPQGQQILIFASKSMADGDMRGLLEAALADKRITIVFLGGEAEGGVGALLHWLGAVGRGLKVFPSMQIDPPTFRKFGIAQVPYAVILRDGKEVARVGGVYSTKWMDEALATRSGDLGTYGRMTTPIELDMQRVIEDRIKHFDFKGYISTAVANFWRDQKMPSVPHATKEESYQIDPSTTITHDIRLPNGHYLAHAGDKVNPLASVPLKHTLLVIDASDPAQRAFAHDQVEHAGASTVIVMSTTVPATAKDGWATWNQWQESVGSHLFAYSMAFANRLNLTGTPAIVTGSGTLLSVRQVVLLDGERN